MTASTARSFQSARTRDFTESVIREMTRLAMKHGAVNLSQGFPDFAAPEEIKEAARRAISQDFNQYAITWGAKSLRDAIAARGIDIVELGHVIVVMVGEQHVREP